MEEYMMKTRKDYASGIARPKIDEKSHFELKGQFLKELRDNTFSGSDNDDANEHIEKVFEIVDLFHIPDVTQDQIMLQVFPMSLTRTASRWPRNEPAAAPGFYQRDNGNPSYQERRQTMEESLSKFMAQSAKRHNENSNLIKEIQASRMLLLEIKEPRSKLWKFKLDLGASVSVMPYSTFTNLGLGELAPTKLISEFADRTIKCRKGMAKNILVCIDKFVFHVDFVVLDMPEDIKVPLILGRPFLFTAHAKIDVFKRKITLRVGDDKTVFESDNPTSNIIKRVFVLRLREQMKLDLEARLMGEALILNRSIGSTCGDYIKLNDLNEPLELRRNQVEDLGPTTEEGEVMMSPWRI
nr:putative reverse transcriptase domain-containing protein [Tanacetum cinerariifolium]